MWSGWEVFQQPVKPEAKKGGVMSNKRYPEEFKIEAVSRWPCAAMLS